MGQEPHNNQPVKDDWDSMAGNQDKNDDLDDYEVELKSAELLQTQMLAMLDEVEQQEELADTVVIKARLVVIDLSLLVCT